MLSIEEISKIDDEILEILQKDAGKVYLTLQKENFENTGRSLTLFHSKMGFIKNGIYDQIHSTNIYCAKILYRSLIEHYLKGQYIVYKSIILNNDSLGEDYYKFADASEKLQLGSAYKKVGEILFPNKKFDDVYDVVIESYHQLRGTSKKTIFQKTSQFNYRKIIEYLYNLFYSDKANDGSENFILKLIPEYSDLSSYIHGGPYADTEIMNFSKKGENAITEEIVEVYFNATLLSTHFDSLLYMFAGKFDKTYITMHFDLLAKVKQLIKLKDKS